MTEALRRSVAVPPHTSAIHMVVGLGLLGAGIALAASSSTETVYSSAPALDLGSSPEPIAPSRAATSAAESPPPPASAPDEHVHLVFAADGAAYMRLADLDHGPEGIRGWPRHAAPRLVREDAVEIAISKLDDAAVPTAYRAWIGRPVLVDDTCRATVTGIAIVSRLVGETSYAGLAKATWDAASVQASGTPVLAARLDRCRGTFARDASLPAVALPELRPDERLATTARSALIASAAGAATQADYAASEGATGSWWDRAEFSTKIVRHPRTGAVLVAVHGHADAECGGPNINVWGLYRAASDGTLAPVQVERLERLHSIERIIDVEGDGRVELIGRPWLGLDLVLADARGNELDSLGMQFYGCAC